MSPRYSVAEKSSLVDVGSRYISSRYSITDKSSFADVGSRSGLASMSKVRRGSFRGANGALFTGITSANGRNGFGQ